MIAVKDIITSSSTVNGNEKIDIDFTNLSTLSLGDTLYIQVFNNEFNTTSIASSTLDKWLDWLVVSYNIQFDNSIASKDGNKLCIQASDNSESNLIIDTGNE